MTYLSYYVLRFPRKEIVYSGPTSGITKKSESGNKTVLNLASESDRCLNSNQTDNIFNPPKRLSRWFKTFWET
jgi:hypothetical protein